MQFPSEHLTLSEKVVSTAPSKEKLQKSLRHIMTKYVCVV